MIGLFLLTGSYELIGSSSDENDDTSLWANAKDDLISFLADSEMPNDGKIHKNCWSDAGYSYISLQKGNFRVTKTTSPSSVVTVDGTELVRGYYFVYEPLNPDEAHIRFNYFEREFNKQESN